MCLKQLGFKKRCKITISFSPLMLIAACQERKRKRIIVGPGEKYCSWTSRYTSEDQGDQIGRIFANWAIIYFG
jgi:hypothetical protein